MSDSNHKSLCLSPEIYMSSILFLTYSGFYYLGYSDMYLYSMYLSCDRDVLHAHYSFPGFQVCGVCMFKIIIGRGSID